MLERVIEARIRKIVKIDDMPFGFSAGRSTTDAVFIVCQVQEKFLEKQKELWIAFVDFEKAFDRVPCDVLWWALRRVGVEEWIINVIKSIYDGGTTSVRMKKKIVKTLRSRLGCIKYRYLVPSCST